MHWTRTLAVALAAAALAGCATTEPAAVLAGGPRMIDLYRGTAAGPAPADRGAAGAAARQAEPSPQARGAPQGAMPEVPKGTVVEATCRWGWFRWPCEAPPPPPPAPCACGEAPAYARTAANELELLFPRLPNPDIYIYVPAHLATELRIPVPGYTTAVPLYDRVEYALPGDGGAARGPTVPPPGVSPEEARAGASPEDTRRGASPEEAGSEASPDEAPPGPIPEGVRPGANPQEALSGANPEVWLGASPQEARLGANAEEASPGASTEEARPDPAMEETP